MNSTSTEKKVVKSTLTPEHFGEYRYKVQMFVGAGLVPPYHTLTGGIERIGVENIPDEGSLVIVGNHISYFDPPLLAYATRRRMVYMAKRELWNNCAFGRILDWLGAIPINREKPELSTLKFIRAQMKRGWSLGMFVEGTRCKIPNAIGRPHLGAAYFAKVTNSPILPVGIVGSNQTFGKVTVKIGKIIMPSDDVEAKTWEIVDSLADLTGFSVPDRRIADKH